MSAINPRVGYPTFNSLDPLNEGARDPRVVPVLARLSKQGTGFVFQDLDFTPYVRQHKLAFIQAVSIDAAGLPVDNFVDVVATRTRHRIRCPTRAVMTAPLFLAEDMAVQIRGTQGLLNLDVMLHFTNFELGMSLVAYAADPMISVL